MTVATMNAFILALAVASVTLTKANTTIGLGPSPFGPPTPPWRENFETPNPARFTSKNGLQHCEPWPHCVEMVDSMMEHNADLGGGRKGLQVNTSSDVCTGCTKPGDLCYDSANKTCAPYASKYLISAHPYTFGDYEVSMRTGHLADGTAAVGTRTCFTPGFSMEHNDYDPLHNEIALCFDGANATQAKFLYCYNQTLHTTIFDLGFDSSAALHTYKVTWRSDSITWYVEGKVAHKDVGVAGKTIPWEQLTMTVGLLKPTGPNPAKSSSLQVEYVSYSPGAAEDYLGEGSAVAAHTKEVAKLKQSDSEITATSHNHEDFEEWKLKHGKKYQSTEEETYRRSVYHANMREADEMQKTEPYATFGSNHLSDLTSAEFKVMLGHIPDVDFAVNTSQSVASRSWSTLEVSSSKDWTGAATTPVKNQGHCGSCWAFSATEQIESDFILQKGVKFVLSPQELVDCTRDGSERYGCAGGSPSRAYKVIEDLGGMELESTYPYIFDDYHNDVFDDMINDDHYYYHFQHPDDYVEQCHFSKSKAKVTVAGYEPIGRGDENEMKKYVGSTGPLSVCLYAKTWHHYKGGILSNCPTQQTDHCVQIVGYGSDDGVDYWKVRNSWGASWGEHGFIRIQFGHNKCNINAAPTKVHAGKVVSSDTSVIV